MSTSRTRSIVLRFVLAAVLAGIVLGVAGRLLMRLIALEAGLPPGYSTGGSLEVVAFGVLLGAPVAIVFWLVRSRISLLRPFAGLTLGTAMTIVLTLLPPPSAQSALAGTNDTPLITLFGFLVLFTAWGAGLEIATGWVVRTQSPSA